MTAGGSHSSHAKVSASHPHAAAANSLPSGAAAASSSSCGALDALHDPSNLQRDVLQRRPPGWHRDYVAHIVYATSPSQSSSPFCFSGTSYPITHFVNHDKFSVRHRIFLATVLAGVDPHNFKESMTDEGWKEAM